MARTPLYEWTGEQYSFEERGTDWYWALGIVSIAIAVTSVLFGNILLALVILTGTGTIALQAAKQPRLHHFAVYDDGIAIDDNLYQFEDMRDFSVLEFIDTNQPPALSIKTNHVLAPHLWIPINGHDPVVIYEYVSRHLPEGLHEETFIDRITTLLRL
ncbi:MAG TPA: hypothetical protein VGB97_03755 [Candidatus Paceibacterota bacterium]|jgi:hypothetical protein